MVGNAYLLENTKSRAIMLNARTPLRPMKISEERGQSNTLGHRVRSNPHRHEEGAFLGKMRSRMNVCTESVARMELGLKVQ